MAFQRDHALDVRDFGAVGDGTTDDTAALQSALNALAATGPVTLIFGPGNYLTGQLTLTNAVDATIIGQMAALTLKATGSRIFALRLVGTCDNVEIGGLRIVGNSVVGDAHAGIGCGNGQTLSNIRVVGNHIENTTLAISFSADLTGTLRGILIANNVVDTVTGTAAGFGYGIHHASAGDTPNGVRIIGNRIKSTQRHAIYQAMGVGTVIANNTIADHRDANSNDTILPALMMSRSRSVVCTGNTVTHFSGGGAFIGGWEPNDFADGYMVTGNTFTDPQDAGACVYVGQQDPSTEGIPSGVNLTGNMFNITGDSRIAIQVFNGKQLLVADNVIHSVGHTAAVTAVRFSGTGETSNTYTDNVVVRNNLVHLETSSGSAVAFRLNGAETITASMLFSGNVGTGNTVMFAQGTTVTNPNFKVQQQAADGLTYSGGVVPWSEYGVPFRVVTALPAASAALRGQGRILASAEPDKLYFCGRISGSTYDWIAASGAEVEFWPEVGPGISATAESVIGQVEFPTGSGIACVEARVEARLNTDETAYAGENDIIVGSTATLTDGMGRWVLGLEPNANITPADTEWVITITRPGPLPVAEFNIVVPDSAGPHDVVDLIV